MRKIEFRAWDIKRKTYDHEELLLATNGDILTSRWQELREPESIYIIEQYTGLKDKNGIKIYEGDIVEYTTCYYGNEKHHRKVVEWEEWDSDDFGEPHNLGYFNLSEYMTVIGNIHESNMEELCPKE